MKATICAAAWIGLALVSAWPAYAAAPSAVPDNKFSIPYNAVSFDVAPFWTALDEHLFQKYGIDATNAGVVHSPALVASILSGESIFAMCGPDAVISADLHGGDIVILAAGPLVDFAVFALKDIQSVKGLKGRTLGVTQFGTSTDFITRYVVTSAGLDPQKDVTILPMGLQANMVTGLEGHVIDAGVLWADDAVHARSIPALHVIAERTDYDLPFYSASLIARKSWIAAHPDESMKVVRGYLAGIAAVFTDKKAAIASIAKYTHMSDPAMLDRSYEALVKVLSKAPVPKPDVIATALRASSLSSAKAADPASFIHSSFVEALQRDGFIDALYK